MSRLGLYKNSIYCRAQKGGGGASEGAGAELLGSWRTLAALARVAAVLVVVLVPLALVLVVLLPLLSILKEKHHNLTVREVEY